MVRFLASRDGPCHEFLPPRHRLRKRKSSCQVRGDGRRISAAGSVCPNSSNERCAQQQFLASIIENINRLSTSTEMSTLQQDSASIAALQFLGCPPHVFD